MLPCLLPRLCTKERFRHLNVIDKYLKAHAEPEVGLLAGLPDFQVDVCCLIPCYKETSGFFSRFVTTFQHSSFLLIVVVNQPESDEQEDVQSSLIADITLAGTLVWECENLSLIQLSNNSYCLVVERFKVDNRIPEKLGVGLARKVGADLAVALFSRGKINSNWIYSTDADAVLPDDYFCLGNAGPSEAAAIFDFKHVIGDSGIQTDEILKATLLYEAHLLYYQRGLAWAGSAYAYHTIGSCIAYSVNAYCSVRGFPKRAAGEDFYLLNKLVKVGEVIKTKPTLRLMARTSSRVPFGTGPAVSEIIRLKNEGEAYSTYNPDIFAVLKALLSAFDTLWLQSDYVAWSKELSPFAQAFLNSQKFEAAVINWRKQCKQQTQFQLQLKGWFDAFRTLKFIHFLREQCYPNVPLQDALQNPHFQIGNQ